MMPSLPDSNAHRNLASFFQKHPHIIENTAFAVEAAITLLECM